MRMTAGVVNVRVRSLDSNDQMEIDTPNLALSILRPGNYRVEVNDAGDATVVKVSEVQAEATGGSQDVVVHAQQAVTFRGTDELSADVGSLGAPDAFDSWSLERDRREQTASSSPSAQYVSPDVTGYEDLDANGRWARILSTDMCGRPPWWRWIGRLIATVAGCGLRRGAGRGSTMRRGDLRHSTTGAGRACMIAGAGCRGRGMCVRCMRRRSWDG